VKRVLTISLILPLIFALTACGSSTDAPSESTVLDLAGGWKQTNSNSDTSYQVAMIAEGTIEVYWKMDDDLSLYWAGIYTAPTTELNEYSWSSGNDKSRTANVLLASGDDTKTFTHKDGVISYIVSIAGVTTTVELERSADVNIQVQKAVLATDLLPLELVDSGYTVKDGYDTLYIQYGFIVKNPNTERAVEYPKIRLKARDADGAVLGTDEIVGSSILPGGTWYSAFQGPSVDSTPATVEFEIVQPNDSDWIAPDRVDNPGGPLAVENPTKRSDKIVGEVSNHNDFDINSAAVVVLFRDDSGKLLAGDTTYTGNISAGSKAAFELSLFGVDETYITDHFEVYAYPAY
jgi:hypothetical protein